MLTTFMHNGKRITCDRRKVAEIIPLVDLSDGAATLSTGEISPPPRLPKSWRAMIAGLSRLREVAASLRHARSAPIAPKKNRVIASAEKRALEAAKQRPDIVTLARQKGEAARRVGARLQPGKVSFSQTAAQVASDRVKSKAAQATRAYVEWIQAARTKLEARGKSPLSRGNAPYNAESLQARRLMAIENGADSRILEALGLSAPRSLVAISAERRLIESVLGKAAN